VQGFESPAGKDLLGTFLARFGIWSAGPLRFLLPLSSLRLDRRSVAPGLRRSETTCGCSLARPKTTLEGEIWDKAHGAVSDPSAGRLRHGELEQTSLGRCFSSSGRFRF
jgi:hypothetical protein